MSWEKQNIHHQKADQWTNWSNEPTNKFVLRGRESQRRENQFHRRALGSAQSSQGSRYQWRKYQELTTTWKKCPMKHESWSSTACLKVGERKQLNQPRSCGCDGKFHLFHQVLGWSSCSRSPTNRHAVVRLGRIVSPDLCCHSMVSSYSYEFIAASSTRTNALSVCGISKPPWQPCNGRVRRLRSRSVTLLDLGVFFCLDAAWLNVSVVRAVALLSATKG